MFVQHVCLWSVLSQKISSWICPYHKNAFFVFYVLAILYYQSYFGSTPLVLITQSEHRKHKVSPRFAKFWQVLFTLRFWFDHNLSLTFIDWGQSWLSIRDDTHSDVNFTVKPYKNKTDCLRSVCFSFAGARANISKKENIAPSSIKRLWEPTPSQCTVVLRCQQFPLLLITQHELNRSKQLSSAVISWDKLCGDQLSNYYD